MFCLGTVSISIFHRLSFLLQFIIILLLCCFLWAVSESTFWPTHTHTPEKFLMVWLGIRFAAAPTRRRIPIDTANHNNHILISSLGRPWMPLELGVPFLTLRCPVILIGSTFRTRFPHSLSHWIHDANYIIIMSWQCFLNRWFILSIIKDDKLRNKKIYIIFRKDEIDK